MKEFNLSDKITKSNVFFRDDIKEFIKRLKEDLKFTSEEIEFIDKLAGDKMI